MIKYAITELQGGDADQEETLAFLYFVTQLLGLDGLYLVLSWPPWPLILRLGPEETGLDLVETNFRPFVCPRQYLDILPLKFAWDGLETIIKKSASKFHISWYQRRVKQRSRSNSIIKKQQKSSWSASPA